MQLFKIIKRHSPGEGDDYIEVKTSGKRCVVVEKVVGSRGKTYDTDANGAGYLIRRLLDERQKMTQQELFDLRIDGPASEPDIHATLKRVMEDNPRAVHSPMLAQTIWAMTHGTSEAA